MAVMLHRNALPRGLDAPPPAVAEDLTRLPDGFGQQSLDRPAVSLDLKKLSTPRGAWRLRTGNWRSVFVPDGSDFLVMAIGLRKDVYERVARMRIGRRGDGLTVLEAPAPRAEARTAPQRTAHAPRTRGPSPVAQNGFSPFDDEMLLRMNGVTPEVLAFLRAVPPSVEVGLVLVEELADTDLASLLADLWERPQYHLDRFDAGVVPAVEDVDLEVDELRTRLRAPESETAVVEVETSGLLRKLLDGSIEDWMVYLHPSQRAIANATFNGPARVRGGPGTGKTVVALHRARVLARTRVEGSDRVLLTTFLRTLPDVWTSLMEALDSNALERLEIRNVDSLAWGLVAKAHGRLGVVDDEGRRKLVEPLLRRHGLSGVMAGNSQLLMDEFDAFIAGRGITELDEYLALRRRGSGGALARDERERVFAAYSDYAATLRKRGTWDWAHLRLEALRLATEGAGPRYDGVVVDEAQDLSAVGVRLLACLDKSDDHRHFMMVGDGQQSIYPGGFSLREVGVDIVGRSRVLTTNWRNTWHVWMAAKAVVEGTEFDDLDDDVGLRPTGEEPAPLTLGVPAELLVLASPEEELEVLCSRIAERLAGGADPGDISILVEVRRKGEAVISALEPAGIPTHRLERYDGRHAQGVLVGTFNRAKGLEFKEVFVPGLGVGQWPSRWFVPPTLAGDARADALDRQVRTLFVGMSRARDRLVLLSAGEPCAPVRQAEWALDVTRGRA